MDKRINNKFKKFNKGKNNKYRRKKKKKPSSKEVINNKNVDEDINKIPLNSKWVLWCHNLYDNNWGIDSYEQIYTFDTIQDFWKLYNNFDSLGGLTKKNYFLMRENIKPIWEDENNRTGGICSLKIPVAKSEEIWTDFSMHLIGECFYEDDELMKDINGISICPKSIWSIVKIWNGDAKNDISELLPQRFKDKYKNSSIKYKVNSPEY